MKKTEEVKPVVYKYKYLCPACSNTAIETTNTMLGVKVQCVSCETFIVLDEKDRYIKLGK